MFDAIPEEKYKEIPFLRLLSEKIKLPFDQLKEEHEEGFNFNSLAEEARSSRMDRLIFVKGLPFTSSKQTLEGIFSKFGHMTETHVISHKMMDQKGNALKIFTGEALIGFKNESTIEQVLNQDFEC